MNNTDLFAQTLHYEAMAAAAEAAARSAGAFIAEELGRVKASDISDKSRNSFVSYVDQEAERMIVAQLRAALPEAGFITEEETVENQTRTLQWIVDPLDGTTNFLHGLPAYAVSIALVEDNEPVVGVVYHVPMNEMFSTWAGAPAFRNGTPIHVAQAEHLADSLLATGFPYSTFDEANQYLAALQAFMRQTRGLRRFGSAAIDLAWTACGYFNGFFELRLSPWDVAAGALLVRNAGGLVTDFSGGENWLFGGEILAAAPHVHPEMLAVLRAAGLGTP